MDENYGDELAEYQANSDYFAERNMCPECETKYDKNDECCCEAIV